MSWEGKYELCEQNNMVPYFKLVGISDEVIEKAKNMSSVTEVSKDGDSFTFKTSYGTSGKFTTNVFTPGGESTISTPSGRVLKGTIALVDGRLVGKFEGNQGITCEINQDGNLKDTMTAGDVTYTRISKRL